MSTGADIWILILQIPLYCLCCNGRACDGCSWSGIWKPEKEIRQKVDMRAKVLKELAQEDTRSRCKRWKDNFYEFVRFPPTECPCSFVLVVLLRLRPRVSLLDRFAAQTEAFRDPCYKWLWIQGFIGQIGGIIQGQFTFFWSVKPQRCCTVAISLSLSDSSARRCAGRYQDCFPHGYYFFHWKIADTVVGATAFNGLVSQILHLGMMPMIRPDYWRDRFGGRPLMIWTGFAGLGLIQPFVYAWLTASPWLYTLIQIWSVWGCFLGCIATSASGAFTMDCLPADDEGRPLSAARDLNLLGWAGRIPETAFPLLLGYSFVWFPNHVVAFRTFFTIGGIFGFITNYIFIFHIHPRDELLDKDFQCTRHWYWSEYDRKRRQGLAGPEKYARRQESAKARVAAANAAEREAQGLPAEDIAARVPSGARCCDEMCFGRGIYDAVWLACRKPAMPATRAEREPLLA